MIRIGELAFLDSDMHPNRLLTYDETLRELLNPANLDMRGHRWRLPTVSEMLFMATLDELRVGGFKEGWYWTSTPSEKTRLAPKDPHKPPNEFVVVVSPTQGDQGSGLINHWAAFSQRGHISRARVRPVLLESSWDGTSLDSEGMIW